jgi:DNA-binding winged helix-turn-helix (wHTH) protein/TolB-like protein/Flp pilus assembly protein TadD
LQRLVLPAMSSQNHNLTSFDDVTVDRENFRAFKAGSQLSLTPRAFDVLVYLMTHTGRVIEKRELFDEVWRGTVVGDNALTKIIKEIRHALDDDADSPKYIETVPRRGYRFIGELKQTSEEHISTAPTPQQFNRLWFLKKPLTLSVVGLTLFVIAGALVIRERSATTAPPIKSIAVLPFKPLNNESRDESLEMGMAEALITRLSNLKLVAVRPVSAVRKYTDPQQDPVKAGQEMQVEAVLDGNIQKAGDRVRVSVRLVNVADALPLWAEQFDESFIDIFKLQDSIAERITQSLKVQLSPQEKERLAKHYTESPEAYQLYLRGQLLWHGRRQNWIEQSLHYYQQAIEKDPNFALAYIGVADSYIMLSGHRKISMLEAETKARPNIMKALQLDDLLAQAHNALAELKYQYEYDWSGAEKEFKHAIDLNPNVAWIHQAYGWFLMSAGRFDEATTEMDRARELDPSSLTINVGRGRLFYFRRQYEQAIQHFQNIIAVEPNDDSSYFSLYTIYEQKKMYPEAVEAYLKTGSLKGAPDESIEELRAAFKSNGWQGFLVKQLENLERTAKTHYVPPSRFANLYVRLGRRDEAFAFLAKTFAEHDPLVLQFKIEPAFDSLRNDPRYAELVRKIGLPPS